MGDVRGLLGDLGVPVERQLGDELRVRCLDPGHDDERASMDVHVETGNVNCRSCPAGGRVASLVKSPSTARR